LDHLVSGGQQRFRDGEAERFGSLEVDDKLDFYGLHDRQIGWFFVRQLASATLSRATPKGELTAPVADEFRPQSCANRSHNEKK
jgi:hypothetical protein